MQRCVVRVGDQFVTETGFTALVDRAKVFPSLTSARTVKGGVPVRVGVLLCDDEFTITLYKVESNCAADGTSTEIVPGPLVQSRIASLTREKRGPFEFRKVSRNLYENSMHQTIRIVPVQFQIQARELL